MIRIEIKEFGFKQKKMFLDMEFELKNRVYVLSGVNGIGKSTLINLITGLVDSDIRIYVNDKKIEPYFNDYIFKVNDSLSNFKYFTLSESIEYFSLTQGQKLPNVEDIIYELKLNEFLNSKITIGDMSRGTVQKCEYLISKIVSASCLLIDEGLENIDVETRSCIMSDILHRSQFDGKCFIIATHDTSIENRATNFIKMSRLESSSTVNIELK